MTNPDKTAIRVVIANVFIRIAASASGQLFAFVLAERMSTHIAAGSRVAGLIGVAYYLTEMLGAPVAGRIADQRGQLRVLRWGPLFGIVAVLLGAAAALRVTAFIQLAALLTAARLAEGVSAACAVPTTLTLLARATDENAGHASAPRLRLMGLFEIASLGGLMGGYVLAGFSWDLAGGRAFLLLPLLYAGAWITVRGSEIRGNESSRQSAGSAWRHLLSAPGVAGFTVAWLAVNAVVGVWLQQAPYLLKLPTRSTTQTLVGGYSATAIGLIFTAWGGLFLLGIALWSIFAPHWQRRRTLAIALGGMLVVVMSLTLVNFGAPKWVLVMAGLAVMIESGFTPAAFAHLADLTDARESARGTAMGIYSLLLGVGQMIGAVLGAPLAAHWQMNGVLAATGFLAIIAVGGVARMDNVLAVRHSAEAH